MSLCPDSVKDPTGRSDPTGQSPPTGPTRPKVPADAASFLYDNVVVRDKCAEKLEQSGKEEQQCANMIADIEQLLQRWPKNSNSQLYKMTLQWLNDRLQEIRKEKQDIVEKFVDRQQQYSRVLPVGLTYADFRQDFDQFDDQQKQAVFFHCIFRGDFAKMRQYLRQYFDDAIVPSSTAYLLADYQQHRWNTAHQNIAFGKQLVALFQSPTNGGSKVAQHFCKVWQCEIERLEATVRDLVELTDLQLYERRTQQLFETTFDQVKEQFDALPSEELKRYVKNKLDRRPCFD